jgi:phosphoenolpyruvate-protein kinase (PTS system EI component)
MAERTLRGMAASPGVAVGMARVLDAAVTAPREVLSVAERRAEAGRAAAALERAAAEITRLASDLTTRGNVAEAEIVETGALMAADPGLAVAVEAAVLEEGRDAAAALLAATDSYAETLAALGDPVLALRADDVRSLGRRAARLAVNAGGEQPSAGAASGVIVARDLGPADVAELGEGVRAIALAAGGVMAHAAIVARSLGIPTVVALGEQILGVDEGSALVVDGGEGSVIVAPGREHRHRAHVATARRRHARERAAAARELPAATADGHAVRVLTNVASAAEVDAGLAAGAEGIGLFRTELRFLDAGHWPTEDEHRIHMAPVLAALGGMTATVRLLDFGGDKTPPFLSGTQERGIALLLAHPDALAAQLAAIVGVGGHTALRVLLPMVERPEELDAVRALLAEIDPGADVALGAMIESAGAARTALAIAARADFLSIGTNDLTHSVLGTDRFAPADVAAHHPEVLRHVRLVTEAAAAGGRIVEVCGEAASDPLTMPILLGLGVDELSVGAARVGSVRAWVRSLRYDEARGLAARTLECAGTGEVADVVRPVAELLAELDDAAGDGIEGRAGVVALGGQP